MTASECMDIRVQVTQKSPDSLYRAVPVDDWDEPLHKDVFGLGQTPKLAVMDLIERRATNGLEKILRDC